MHGHRQPEPAVVEQLANHEIHEIDDGKRRDVVAVGLGSQEDVTSNNGHSGIGNPEALKHGFQ